MNPTLQQIVKHSAIYGYFISQPFATYIDSYPFLESKILQQAEELKSGYHGEAVRILQKKLKILTYYKDDLNGNYNLQTEHAVKNFQAEHDLSITGIADHATKTKLLNIEREFYFNQLIYLTPLVYPGMVSTKVKRAQEALKYFEYYEGEIDGIYGPLTKNAFERAEMDYGLDLTNHHIEAVTHVEAKDPPIRVDEEVEAVQEQATPTPVEEQIVVQKEKKGVDPVKEEAAEKVEETPVKIEAKEEKKLENISTNHSSLIQNARSLIGTPYVWGGTSTNGFDCSGFIQFVYQSENITIPRTVSDIWNFSTPVHTPSIGDLVFFETYKPGPSHMGIYLGDGKFIHAGLEGVVIANLSTSYWQQRYLGAKRIE